MNKAIMHINYAETAHCLIGNKTIDDICRMAAEIGFDGIEFRGNPPKELEPLGFREYAEEIAKARKKYGLSEILFGIHMYKCSDSDKEVREKDIADAIEKARLASEICGTTVCNTVAPTLRSSIPSAPPRGYEFHGSAVATEEEWKLTVEAYQRLACEAEKLGMKFGFETHPLHIHDTPEQTMKLVNLIDSPAIGVNMDFGNTVYFREHPSVEEAIDLYGDKLFYTHLKNSSAIPGTGNRTGTPLSDGEINHRLYLAKLREVGFSGPIGIEAPRAGDRRYFAERDFSYFKSVYSSIYSI